MTAGSTEQGRATSADEPKVPVSASPIPQPGLLPEGEWRVDPSRSRVEFTVRKLGAGTVRGRFADADGVLATGNEDRDAHLRSPVFFAAETYPEIAFTSREIVPVDQRRFGER